MPESVTSVFSEPCDFEAALREEGGLGLLITGRGRFRARLTQIALDHLRLSAAEEHLARIAFVEVPADMVLIALPVGAGPAPVWGGIGMQAGEITTLGPGHRAHARTDGPCWWGNIRLPAEVLTRYGRALLGAMPALPLLARRWRPAPAAKAHLRSLHAAAVRMAKVHPEILIDPQAAHGLEQQLIHALVDCLSAGPMDEDVSADRHRDILARFEGVFDMQPFLRVAEICAVLGVSNGVLRRCCEEQLGMTPSSYLGLRRMQQVHRALRSGDLEAAGVAEVARRYGVRDLGRFTTSYRAFYGELPTATLRRGASRGVTELTLGRPRVKFP